MYASTLTCLSCKDNVSDLVLSIFYRSRLLLMSRETVAVRCTIRLIFLRYEVKEEKSE
jgi:hypothetical protein